MSSNSSGKRGPRANGADTRGAILESAREAFAAKGYAKASIRQIAAAAGVDASLVSYYFGTKDRLYLESIHPPQGPADILVEALAGPVEDLGENLVRGLLTVWATPEARSSVQGVLRSLSEREDFGAFVVQYAIEKVLAPLANHLGGTSEAYQRAALAGTQLLGLGISRYFVFAPALDALKGPDGQTRADVAEMIDMEGMIAEISGTVQHYLTGDLTRPAP